jgi:hypothetical protein
MFGVNRGEEFPLLPFVLVHCHCLAFVGWLNVSNELSGDLEGNSADK